MYIYLYLPIFIPFCNTPNYDKNKNKKNNKNSKNNKNK